jgi:hypothetical protein
MFPVTVFSSANINRPEKLGVFFPRNADFGRQQLLSDFHFYFLFSFSNLNMTKQRLAIIGKGLVASAIAKQATKTYGSVTMVSRNKPLEIDQLPNHVNHVQGNALYPSPFSDVIRSADAVVSTVGIIKENKDHDADETFERLNRDAVVSVAREMVKTQPADLTRRCLVYFSAANAPPGFLLDPRYINTKREAEDALLSEEFKDKLRVVIFRPGKVHKTPKDTSS